MVRVNGIINGTFSAGSAGWSGIDLETSYGEGAYLGNGSANAVAETDGRSGQTTVMEQAITVNWGQTTDLTFRTALRTASNPNAGSEGFRVDILDAGGAVIASQTFLPTSNAWTAQTMAVTFPTGGTYTVRFTELGPDDSLGAIVDDISMLVCFTAGTLIRTDRGARAVETLVPGDRVWTLDDGFQAVRWISRRDVSRAEQVADARLCPVVFAPGALGPGLPARELRVSPQHRMLIASWKAELHFGSAEVLVPALALVNGRGVTRAAPADGVAYVHFLLGAHQIVEAEGALSESFFPGAVSLRGVAAAAQDELFRLFPALRGDLSRYGATARPVLRPREVLLVA